MSTTNNEKVDDSLEVSNRELQSFSVPPSALEHLRKEMFDFTSLVRKMLKVSRHYDNAQAHVATKLLPGFLLYTSKQQVLMRQTGGNTAFDSALSQFPDLKAEWEKVKAREAAALAKVSLDLATFRREMFRRQLQARKEDVDRQASGQVSRVMQALGRTDSSAAACPHLTQYVEYKTAMIRRVVVQQSQRGKTNGSRDRPSLADNDNNDDDDQGSSPDVGVQPRNRNGRLIPGVYFGMQDTLLVMLDKPEQPPTNRVSPPRLTFPKLPSQLITIGNEPRPKRKRSNTPPEKGKKVRFARAEGED